jgi:hypothetical protein
MTSKREPTGALGAAMDGDELHYIAAERYTARPLPGYRFIPGETPHPTADPRGHSYRPPGVPPPPAPPYPGPAHWAECETYLFGCDLYNHAYWWEAHEAWESLWLQAPVEGEDRQLLQGLIQTANAHLKLRMRRFKAVDTLRGRYRAHLAPLAAQLGQAPLMGLQVADWLERLEAYYQPDAAGNAQRRSHDPKIFPFLLMDLK